MPDSLLAAFVAILLVSTGFAASRASGTEDGFSGSCAPGWYVVEEQDNSFLWQESAPPFRSVSWTGSVQMQQWKDSACRVQELQLDFTGPFIGGTLILAGNPSVSFTVQYPAGFHEYADAPANAFGELVAISPPAGDYLTYRIVPRFDLNSRGADEYVAEGLVTPAIVTNVRAVFLLPLALLGRTVEAQIHVGPDLCLCEVTEVNIPDGTGPHPLWDVYVGAHADDWQVFDSPNAFYDARNGDNMIFVYTTAGDLGLPSWWWQAREEATKESVRWLMGDAPEGAWWVRICHSEPERVCHEVWQWIHGRATAFFLRLPDGNLLGGGFPATGNVSLHKLRDGIIPTLETIDESATYSGWPDFYLTLKAIIETYTPYDWTTWINTHDYDRERQTAQGGPCPGCPDHSDHLATADAIREITIAMGTPWSRALYIDYPIGWADSRYPVNLDAYGYEIKKHLFMAYSDTLKRLTNEDEYSWQPEFWENAFWRTHYRVV